MIFIINERKKNAFFKFNWQVEEDPVVPLLLDWLQTPVRAFLEASEPCRIALQIQTIFGSPVHIEQIHVPKNCSCGF